MQIDFAELTGRTAPPLKSWSEKVQVHAELWHPLQALIAAAEEEGFALQIASGYRDYARQLLIWNEKGQGLRPLFDENGEQINPLDYSPEQLLFKLLRWSALPGASRHHWGTEIDVFDERLIAAQDLQLTEAEADTVLKPFHEWLDFYLPHSPFFRPYAKYKKGFAREPWHLSYHPLAKHYQKAYTLKILQENITQAPQLLLREPLQKHLAQIYENYLQDIDRPAQLD